MLPKSVPVSLTTNRLVTITCFSKSRVSQYWWIHCRTRWKLELDVSQFKITAILHLVSRVMEWGWNIHVLPYICV